MKVGDEQDSKAAYSDGDFRKILGTKLIRSCDIDLTRSFC